MQAGPAHCCTAAAAAAATALCVLLAPAPCLQALASDSDQCYRAFFATGCRVLAITAPRSTAEFHGTRGKGNVYIPEPVEVGHKYVSIHTTWVLRACSLLPKGGRID